MPHVTEHGDQGDHSDQTQGTAGDGRVGHSRHWKYERNGWPRGMFGAVLCGAHGKLGWEGDPQYGIGVSLGTRSALVNKGLYPWLCLCGSFLK